MDELRKFIAPEFVFGLNARLLLGQYLINFGTERAMIVTDKNIRSYKWFEEILETIETEYVIFDSITPNPKDYEVHSGAEVYMSSECDIIVAIGGGSVIDCAKGIGTIVENDGKISDFEGVDQIKIPLPILISIPSTAGSAADVSQFAIITNTEDNYKMVLASKILVPDLALIDPVVTTTCDLDLTIDTSLDALVHAIEAYVSNASSFMTDMHALKAIEIITQYLPELVTSLDNLNYRSSIIQACLHAGLAFSNASLGLVHAMAHALGGRYDLVHGEINAILLEHVVAFNYSSAIERYNEIQILMENIMEQKFESLTECINHFITSIRPNKMVHELYTQKINFEALAAFVLKDPCIVTNPANVSKEDVVKIYERVL